MDFDLLFERFSMEERKKIKSAYDIFSTPLEWSVPSIKDKKKLVAKYIRARDLVAELFQDTHHPEATDGAMILQKIDDAIEWKALSGAAIKKPYHDLAEKELLKVFSKTQTREILKDFRFFMEDY